ncbi:serine protease [Streptomyces sp. LP11]|uniref:Serine protease n=1 Tax=Streptomyces pyxinicus TaxID=2970331 RepID=A0ABT2B5C3_9ACTN|nr:serine protease [Streptomyces sp. LP11]MCS0603715.1 serine protease [Streptomyces sp. LP11]
MEYTQIFGDAEVREEFLDRFTEIRDAVMSSGGLEGVGALEGMLQVDRAGDAVKRMAEGTWHGDGDSGLEAIVRKFGRPVYLIRRNTFATAADAPDDDAESLVIAARVSAARRRLEGVIPSVGRVDLRNHDETWVGTAWMVADGLAVTNHHVAKTFATRRGDGFVFRESSGARVHAYVDWYHEHGRTRESRFRVTEVVWMEPDPSCDAALIRLAPAGEDGEPLPPPIPLAEGDEGVRVGRWVGVIGYPWTGRHDDPADRTRIFDGIFECKRLAPGRIISFEGDRLIHHDATTLGGNSGSVVVDLDTGRALGLHYQGWPKRRNYAVRAASVARLVHRHAS